MFVCLKIILGELRKKKLQEFSYFQLTIYLLILKNKKAQ